MAGGVEAGIELLGMDLWGEAVWMANSQAMYSGNFGFDLTFGSDLRVNVGLYTGPIGPVYKPTFTRKSLPKVRSNPKLPEYIA